MRPFHDWLDRVLTTGESEQSAPPRLAPEERSAVETRLRAEFELHALDLAGPPMAFDPSAALLAATVLARACWHLVGADEGEPLALGLDTKFSPAAHLSADVAFRFLPSVYRRARGRNPASSLTAALDCLLRAWPLSGVLADLDGEPTTAPEFGHTGLQLLYAERLAMTRRVGWVPTEGSAREWVERVFAQLGLPVPPKENARV